MQKTTQSLKRKMPIRWIIITTVAIILVGGLAASYGILGKQIAGGLVYNNQGQDTHANSIQQLAAWGYDLQGFQAAHAEKNLWIPSEDGTLIPLTAYAADNKTQGTAILLHGLGGDHVAVAPIADMYLSQGWDVVALDQRASGLSQAGFVSYGYYEKNDVQAVVDHLRATMPQEKLVVHGQSMGAATAAQYAVTAHAKANNLTFILDSCPPSMKSVFLLMWHDMGTPIPDTYAIWCANWYMKWHYGFNFNDLDLVALAKHINSPLLMIHSAQDELVSGQDAQMLFDAIGSKDKAYWIAQSVHVKSPIDYPAEYSAKVFDFIQGL